MESENTRPEHPLEEFFAPGANAEAFGVRPGDMPEHDHCCPRKPFANEPRHETEVVVLNEDDRVIRVDFVAERVREFAVHGAVVFEVRATKDWTRVCDVTERPESLVREAVV